MKEPIKINYPVFVRIARYGNWNLRRECHVSSRYFYYNNCDILLKYCTLSCIAY